MVKNRFSAIIFDLGNVFVRVDPTHAIQALERSSDLKYNDIHSYFTSSKTMQLYEKGILTNQQFYRKVVTDLDISVSIDRFKELWQSVLFPVKPMIYFLSEVRYQYPCYLLSNTNDWHIEYCERKFLFLKWFKQLFYSYRLGLSKPDPAIYKKILRLSNLQADQTLFIDDNQDNIQTAMHLGMQTIHFTGHARFLRVWESLH